MTEIILPNTLNAIGEYAFEGCVSLTEVDFPEGLTSLGRYCFSGCTALLEADLPDTVTTIGRNCFSGCTVLEHFHYPLAWTTVKGDGLGSGRILNNCTALTSVTVPEGVTIIPEHAFDAANCLTEIILPNTLNAIGNSAFEGCVSLTEIVVPKGVTSIGSKAFSGCNAMTMAVFYSNVSNIGSNAFDNHSTELVIRCYSGSTAETYAINNGITTELLEGNWLNWRITSDGCLHIFGEGPMTDYVSGAAPWTEQSDEIYSIHIDKGVTTIANYAFENLATVTCATIPETITSIGSCAFSGCVDLGQLFLDETVTSIGIDAFRNCVRLKLICFRDSAAHQYAVDNNLNCELITITYMSGITNLKLLKGSVVELPSPLFVIQPEDVIGNRTLITSSNASIVSIGSDEVMTAKANGTTTITLQLIEHPTTIYEIEVTVVSSMNTFTMPYSLTTLESGALAGVATERIVLPTTLTSIAGDAIIGSSNLRQLVVSSANLHLPVGLLSGCDDAVVICPKNSEAAADCMQYSIPCLYVH